MSPTTLGPNDVLREDNYFLWEFNCRMALARKDLLDHVEMKPEDAAKRETETWKAADFKALAVISKLLSPVYQSMIRESKSAKDAWETLREFFVKQNLHNRAQLRKQLHEFQMTSGADLMDHLLKFDDLCLRLSAVGDQLSDDEKLVILLGSLSNEYDAMVKIIEAHASVTLMDAKEMLRRESETLKKREKQEGAFNVSARGGNGSTRRRNNAGSRGTQAGQHGHGGGRQGGRRGGGQQRQPRGGRGASRFDGRCFECNQFGHKRAECPTLSKKDDGDEFVFAATKEASTAWLLDSGASTHMTHSRHDFVEFRELQSPTDIVVASGQRLRAMGVGTVRFLIGSGRVIKVTEVLYVPGLDRRLLSIPSLVAKGVSVEFSGNGCTISFEGRLVARVEKGDKLFVWNVVASTDEERGKDVAASVELSSGSLWHERLGHVSKKKMMLVSHAAEGVPSFGQDDGVPVDAPCAGCSCGKMTVSPFARKSGSSVKTAGLLDIVHSDVMGPMKPQSKGGARLVVTFVDDYSRYVHMYLIKAKTEVFARFVEYKALVEAQTGRRIRCLRSDNGGEYVNKKFGDFFAAHGIVHQTSTPHTPQQNGLAERMNRTLVEMARSMLYHRGMAREWWGEALSTAVYLTNRVPNTARPQTTPYEVFTGCKPDLSHLRVFGSRGYVHVDKSRRSKWDARAHACIFLGYAPGSKAYRVWDAEDERIVTTRTITLDERPADTYRTVVHVTRQAPLEFDEDVSTSQQPQQPVLPATNIGGDVEMTEVDGDPVDMETDAVPDALVRRDEGEMSRRGGEGRAIPASEQRSNVSAAQQLTGQPSPCQSALIPSSVRSGENSLSDHLVFGPTRPRQVRISAFHQPRLLASAQEAETPALPALPPSEERGETGEAGQLLLENGGLNPTSGQDATGDGYTSDGSIDEPDAKRPRIDDEYEIALAASESIPNSFREAMRSADSDKWKEACRAEIRAHVRNHTWDLVYRPPGARVIGHKWVFALKRDEHGNIIRYKARLVALGCFQTYGVDYTSTYSPVASLNTVRIFLAVCCQLGYMVKQYDVETAFLNGDLEEEVYMVPPECLNVREGMVCHLRRSLYGLKQAAAVWHKTIRSVFIALGFKQCKSDPCLFVRVRHSGPVFIVLYVDDLLIGCAAEEEASSVADALGARFRLKSLGDARFILGMELRYNAQSEELFVSQAQYISRMIERFGQAEAHPVRNPNVVGQDLRASDEHPRMNEKKPYRELIGSLLYVANATRPDICVAVSILSQHLEDPREMHWKAAVRVLRYLKGTLTTGVKYCRGTQLRLLAFSDANWGSDLSTRRSTSGVLLQLCDGPVVFKAKKQATVALSSAEAEYMALAVTVQEVMWVRQLLKEMLVEVSCATEVFVDNKAAISMASNSGYTPRAKHIDLRVHFVRDQVENGTIKVQHVRSAQQLADYLTKPLPTPQFMILVKASGVVSCRDPGMQVEGEC